MLFVNIIVPVFLIIICGWALGRYFHLDLKPFTTSTLYLFAPALVLSALLKHPIQADHAVDVVLFMLIYTAIMFYLAKLVARLLSIDDECKPALTLTTVMMNVGNFGLPLSYFAFGERGVPIAILVFVIFNLPLATLAIVIAQGKQARLSTAIINCLKIPILHAVVLALLLCALKIELPLFLARPLDLIGQVAVPLMLVVLGMQISQTKWHLPGKFMSLASTLRLIIAPVIAWTICKFLHIEGLYRDIIILQTSTPSAVLPLLYALRFDTRPDLVASTIVVTTLLSAGTLTLLLYLLPYLP
ncbi:MAG: AEC family transporter [Thermodesulfobacteriota bacterium]|nr:AEC family transporter [Thermodesulfobacteriota bacterium]